MNFVDAVKNTEKMTTTENGMVALESSMNAITDLFYTVGSNRGKDLTALFERALQENQDVAIRLAQFVRDIRGGMGERKMFLDFLQHLEKLHPELLTNKFLHNIVEIGRFKDLLAFQSETFRQRAWVIWTYYLSKGNRLAAKWAPRKGKDADEFRHFLQLTPKQYRKLIVHLTDVVETKMCAKLWDQIEYSHVPSLAMTRYTNAFKKNDPAGFEKYKSSLEKGETKINASAVYPYQVIQSLERDVVIGREMWEALPNYMSDALVLPMVDVSGSMTCPASGIKGTTCMDIALSLGLYCADKNKGPFKDMFLTFSEKSNIEILKGDIHSKLAQLRKAVWGMSTNIEGAFDEILQVAIASDVSPDDMPQIMLILSDMQFNQATNINDRVIDVIRNKYEAAGYEVPKIVFWNLAGDRGSNNNLPVKFDENGTALVSGFSPSLMKAILNADLNKFNPLNIVLDAVMIDRYNWR